MTIPIDLKGKGWWIWYIPDIEDGDVVKIVDKCLEADISHVIIKIANGVYDYGIDDSGFDMAKALVDEIHARAPHMKALGWSFTYAAQPEAEAGKCIERVRETGVDMFVVDAESHYKVGDKSAIALRFMTALRAGLPDMPFFLCSYRYPSLHPQFPWSTFRAHVDADMPQVYWEGSHNPAYQLNKSYSEFMAMTPVLPYIPVGSAYKRGSDWQATVADINEFLNAAKNTLELQAANFWEWGRMSLYVPELWQPIADFDWPYYEEGEEVNTKTFCVSAAVEVAAGETKTVKIPVPAGTAWSLEAINAFADRAISSIKVGVISPSGVSVSIAEVGNASIRWNALITVTENENIAATCKAYPGMTDTTLTLVVRGEILEQPA